MFAHDTLLLAGGSMENRRMMREIFGGGYNLLEAANANQTMILLEQNCHCIATVLLDVSVPDAIDMSVLSRIKQVERLRNVPVVVLTPPDRPESVGEAFRLGAIEAMGADYESYVLLRRVQNIVDLHRHKWHLEELVDEQASVLKKSNDAMVGILSSIVEYRSVESGQHILRIRGFTRILLQEIARSWPRYVLTDQNIDIISSAAALHDVGKISIPDAILNKPGPLTEQERQIMNTHAVTGAQIIRTLSSIGDHEYLRYAYNICRYHHERWDGGGYPDGLAGDSIPICAQAVGLADAYDALTTKRVYKEAVSCEQAANMIVSGECGAFSPAILECFKHVAGKFAELARNYADGHSPNTETFDTQLPGPVQKEELDALQMVQSKYQMMLHFIDATVAEVDLDQGICHVVYNPDPNLAMLQTNSSLAELNRKLETQAPSPEAKAHIRHLVEKEFPRFLQDGLMRLNYRTPIYVSEGEEPLLYDMTVLRQSLADQEQRKLIVIWRRAADVQPAEDEQLRQMAELCVCRNDRYLTLTNSEPAAKLLGYTVGEIRGQFDDQLMQLIDPEDRTKVRQQLAEQILRGKEILLEYRLRCKNGNVIWVLHKNRLTAAGDGTELLAGVLADVTSIKKQQEHLENQLQRQQIILSQTENVLYEWDLLKDELTFSDSWEKIFGYPPVGGELFTRLSGGSHFHPDDVSVVLESIAAMQRGSDYQVMEVRVAKADGRYLWCRFRSTGQRDENGQIIRMVGVIINIDEEKRSAQALQERAERDSLTKLLNKHAAQQQAERYLASSSGSLRCALFIIDLDDFKQINDRYGHLFGDSVLFQVSREIKRLFRAQDIVARIGGDEFMVLMRGVTDRQLVESRCALLLDAFHNVMRTQLQGSGLSCSVGVALFPQHGKSYAELFKRADQALYHAKDMGKDNFAIFDSEDAFYYNRRMLETTVKTRIDSDDQSSLAGGNIIHYAFRHLYESQDLESTIGDILALVGRQMNVSRVYIFENSEDNRYCSNTFEWCNDGILPQIDFLQNISYDEDIPNFINAFDEHGIFYCPDINQLPADLYRILEPQNIKSLLHCAIRDNGVMRGYIGFDECHVNRYWTKEQIEMLTFFAEMLSVFLLKKRAQDENARLREGK